MDAPICTNCRKRHWSTQSCEGSVAQSVEQRPFKPPVAGSTPARSTKLPQFSKAELAAEKVPPPPKKIEGDETPGIVVGYDFKAAANCPECAMRRAKQREATKRWREKRK